MDRRSFIKMTVIGVGTAIMGGAIYQIVREVTGADEKEQTDRFITLGSPEDFTPDSVREYSDDQFFLVRREDSGFLALHSECTHRGCDVQWAAREREFQCPCHGSVYGMNGEVIEDPAPRPLDVHPLKIEAGNMIVNVGRRIERDKADNEYVIYNT